MDALISDSNFPLDAQDEDRFRYKHDIGESTSKDALKDAVRETY